MSVRISEKVEIGKNIETTQLVKACVPTAEIYRDSASALFQQIEERCLSGSIEEKVKSLRDIFYHFVDQEVHDCDIVFSGLFSKVDYLIKENNIPQETSYNIHETRKSLFGMKDVDDEDFLYDIMDTCIFISKVKGGGIPAALSSRFPNEKRKLTWGKYDANLIRVVLNSWDKDFLYVTEEEYGRELKVCYSKDNQYLTRNGAGDWSYLQKIFCKDAQLNLVRNRFEEEICKPELIIFEPDYLVSITTIARCFDEKLRQTPFYCLIDKLSPNRTSTALQLGNLAGALLDETVHKKTSTFAECYDEFFHRNIISFMCNTTSGNFEYSIQKEGADQKQNIDKLIGSDITHIKNYDREKVILEPSFFSEVLGIQGRLDFLYEDNGDVMIVEQKSGKAWSGNQGIISPKQEHVVQLLLYRALFNYEFEKYSRQLKHLFLLYSKYSNGLIDIAQRPELMLDAIRMRNLIAWCEIQYAHPGGFKVLESISPMYLCNTSLSENDKEFFQKYYEPRFTDVIAPLHAASALEKAYYYRLQQFLQTENLLDRLGNRTKEASGFASVWLDTLETKKTAGSIYDQLHIVSFGEKNGEVQSVTLSFADDQNNDTSNFRRGDGVFLYHYQKDNVPNACAQMVHRGSIIDLTEKGITIRLTNSQTDKKVFLVSNDILWAVEPDKTEAGSSSVYRNMHSFLSAKQERRNLILLQREPETDSSISLTGDYGEHNDLVLNAKRAKDIFLVIGPPGTGKTSHAMLNILREELLSSDSRILLLSYTNRAVDEMCQTLEDAKIDYMRVGNDLGCGKNYVPHLLQNQLQNCKDRAEAVKRFTSARVVCGTTSSLNSNIALLALKGFSLAIIDESSQILEPQIVGLMSAKCGDENAIRRLVLIGDHKQLPAVVQQEAAESAVTEQELINIGIINCRISFFERMLHHFTDNVGNYNPDFVYMLKRQGRMHPDIAQFPNYAFYANKLENLGPEIVPHQGIQLERETSSGNGIRDMLTTRYISFVATPALKGSVSDKVNQPEANMIASTIIQIYRLESDCFDSDRTVGVIVPYRNQISTIRNTIERLAREHNLSDNAIQKLHNITIDTVERYQGSQRRYIIYGFTVQRTYQLNFLTSSNFVENGITIDRKLNVAMTRAREHLIIFGNPEVLNENAIYYKMMEFIRSKNGYICVPEDKYCSGQFKIGRRSSNFNICLDNSSLGMSMKFEKAFEKFVVGPIKADKRTRYPEFILGNTQDVNLTQIDYGRVKFSNQLSLFSKTCDSNTVLSPNDQALLYSYYLMRMRYATMSAIYRGSKDWLTRKAYNCNGRVYMFDIGSGPATSGLALVDSIPSFIAQMDYNGIDTSAEMNHLAYSLMNHVCDSHLDMSFRQSMSEFDDTYWKRISSVPCLVIFNLSYFFSSVTDRFSEQLASQIQHIMTSCPLNDYVFIMQQSQTDNRIKSYRIFSSYLRDYVHVLRKDVTNLEFMEGSELRNLSFAYEIWENKK